MLGLLADEERLRVLAGVVLGAGSAEAVTEATGLEPRRVARALERLLAGGLVGDQGGRLVVRPGRFAEAARAVARMRPSVSPEDLGASPEAAAVLRGFMEDGRLVSIPTARAKRRVLLDFLATRFEPGRVYPERDVNALLQRFHADHAALRRYLVDEEFLERRDRFYWRAGGTFEVD